MSVFPGAVEVKKKHDRGGWYYERYSKGRLQEMFSYVRTFLHTFINLGQCSIKQRNAFLFKLLDHDSESHISL